MTEQEFIEWLKMQRGPRVSEQDYFSIRPVPRTGHFKTKDTTHIKAGNIVVTGRENAKFVTKSGRVISAEEINLRCSICGEFDSEGERCDACKQMVCVRCVRRVDVGYGKTAFCPEHARLAFHYASSWLLEDRKGGS
jgi:hypothetical protein